MSQQFNKVFGSFINFGLSAPCQKQNYTLTGYPSHYISSQVLVERKILIQNFTDSGNDQSWLVKL